MSATVLRGDCRALMAAMPDDSLDALVSDPPYGLGKTPPIVEILTHWLAGEDVSASGGGFMGRTWDSFVPGPATWREAFRVLKPGAHGVVFAGDRTVDLMALALRLAGFEVRHVGAWVSAQVFPKSLDVSKAIDALAGAEREVIGEKRIAVDQWTARGRELHARGTASYVVPETAPATPEAAEWSGYGTALKTLEPWILVRKPLSESSIARNVLRWGTGALNIDGCRLPFASDGDLSEDTRRNARGGDNGLLGESTFRIRERRADEMPEPSGRWPSALIASDLDVTGPVAGVRVIGEGVSSHHGGPLRRIAEMGYGGGDAGGSFAMGGDGDGGGLDGILGPYTRHFRIPGTDGAHDDAIPPEVESLIICAKASTAEREEGLEDFEARCGWTDGRAVEIDNPRLRMGKRRRNVHPTVKPVALMRHLVRLVTPPGGTCLDPFTGSGSTGVAAVWEGRGFVGCELTDTEAEPFVRIALARIAYAERTPPPELRCRAPKPDADERQVEMFGT